MIAVLQYGTAIFPLIPNITPSRIQLQSFAKHISVLDSRACRSVMKMPSARPARRSTMRPEPHGALGPQCKCLMAYDRTNPLQSFSVRQNQGLMSQANHSTCLPKCCCSFAGQEDEVWTNDLCRPPPDDPKRRRRRPIYHHIYLKADGRNSKQSRKSSCFDVQFELHARSS